MPNANQQAPGPANRRDWLVWLAVLAAVAGTVWWGLGRLAPRADWLEIETGRDAVVGAPLKMRVHLKQPARPGWVSADLHWARTRDQSQGFLASGGSRPLERAGGTYDFAVPVPPREGLRYVAGVIYLGPTGNWETHTRAAITELIPVTNNTGLQAGEPLHSRRVQPLRSGPEARPPAAAWPRVVLGLGLLLSAVLAWRARLPGKHG